MSKPTGLYLGSKNSDFNSSSNLNITSSRRNSSKEVKDCQLKNNIVNLNKNQPEKKILKVRVIKNIKNNQLEN